MSDDYLWDKSGKADPEVQRLELLLSRYRHNQPPPALPALESGPWYRRLWNLRLVPQLAVGAAAAVIVITVWIGFRQRGKTGWEVASLEGRPRIGSSRIANTGVLGLGEWLETDNNSRAQIKVGNIGEVQVEPNTRVRLVNARVTDHRLALERGTIRARIWAPPRLFSVETPSATAVDLGCAYTLQVDDSGAGLLRVSSGWVAFVLHGRESFVPAGAMAQTRPGIGPGTPYYEDASAQLQQALSQLDFGGVEDGIKGGIRRGSSPRTAALKTVLAEARPRDALTLWHLLSRLQGEERATVFQKMAMLAPPPKGVTMAGILAGDQRMLDLWWNELGLGSTNWWRIWERPWSGR